MEITSVGQFQRVKWGKKEGKKEGNGKLEGGGGGGGKEWRKTKVPIIPTPRPRYNVSCKSRVRTTIHDLHVGPISSILCSFLSNL